MSAELPHSDDVALEIARLQIDDLKRQVEQAYNERNELVSALAHIYPSGLRPTEIEGWEPEWQNCVYIDLPAGQVSYHFHDKDKALFDGLPAYTKDWDNHDKELVHARLEAIRHYPALYSLPMLHATLAEAVETHQLSDFDFHTQLFEAPMEKLIGTVPAEVLAEHVGPELIELCTETWESEIFTALQTVHAKLNDLHPRYSAKTRWRELDPQTDWAREVPDGVAPAIAQEQFRSVFDERQRQLDAYGDEVDVILGRIVAAMGPSVYLNQMHALSTAYQQYWRRRMFKMILTDKDMVKDYRRTLSDNRARMIAATTVMHWS